VQIIEDDTTVHVNGLICARHDSLVWMNYGPGGPNTVGKLITEQGSSVTVSGLAARFGQGLLNALKSVTVEPILQVRDMGLAGASVVYNEVFRGEGKELWFPEMKSGTAQAAASGVSQERLVLQSNPITGIGVASYDLTTAVMNGDWETVAEMSGGLLGGLAIGKAAGYKGGNGVKIVENPIRTLSPFKIRFSQKTVSLKKNRDGKGYNYKDITDSMERDGWNGDPVDIVKMPDGELTSVDNTRILAARETGTDVQAVVHDYNEPLSPEIQNQRGWQEYNTWGEATEGRIDGQGSAFRTANPNGTHDLPRINGAPE
jgi:hypothetical protein